MKSNKPFPILLVFFAAALLLIGGCGKDKERESAKTTTPTKETAAVKVEEVKPQPSEPVVEPAKTAAAVEPVKQESLPMERTEGAATTSHVVKKGECLWWIAQDVEVYNDPWQWSRIYEANREQIEDPDLIYPGQVLKIPR
jgi:nucleoid-associated protein YgaU